MGNISPSYMSNYVYFTNTSSSLVTSKEGNNVDTVGQTVCISGRVSGFTCGALYAKGFSTRTATASPFTISARRPTPSPAVIAGQRSLRTTRPMGIQSGVNGAGRAIYSHIYNLEVALNATAFLGP